MLIDQRLATLTIAEGEEIIRSLHTAPELCNAIEGTRNAGGCSRRLRLI